MLISALGSAANKAWAQFPIVAPVVNTSSTSKMRFPLQFSGMKASYFHEVFSCRAVLSSLVCEVPLCFFTRKSCTGSCMILPIPLAISSA